MEDQSPSIRCPGCESALKRIAALEAQVVALTAALEETRRAGKRQAAPFRKGPPASQPKTPGRKSGDDYGQQARRDVPADEDLDEIINVPLPTTCPRCESCRVSETHVAQQYQIELPAKPIQRRFDVHIGCCQDCGQRLQGRHELQTSDALGAAAVQLGAQAHAAMAWLNKSLGLAHGKIVKLFEYIIGISINRSTSVRSILRTATRCVSPHAEIRQSVRGSPRVTPDETGWRVGGRNAWLHVFVGQRATLFEVARGRGFEVAAGVLGAVYNGHLIHDGWSAYDRFTDATHQQCVAHILRRARELRESARGYGIVFPSEIMTLFQDALALRDEFMQGGATREELVECAALFETRLESLATITRSNTDQARFARYLLRHSGEWFTFLKADDIDATNYRAEQAIRPAVVNRKVWGGNRTWTGAQAQSVLTSVIVTCEQLAQSPLHFIRRVLTELAPPQLIPATR